MKTLLIHCLLLGGMLMTGSGPLRAQQTTLNIGSYNIRYANPNDAPDPWEKRHPVVINMIKFHEMDIIGIQEGLNDPVFNLSEGLPDYCYVRVARGGGSEHGVFYVFFYNNA